MAPLQLNRKSQGRKKIEIEKIKDETARAVTFSKRRSGLFKKASELCILCGAHIAIIIISYNGGAFSFGHPSVESFVRQFFDGNLMQNLQDPAQGTMAHSALLADLNDVNDRKDEQSEIKKRRGKELETALESSVLSNEKMSQLDLNELQLLKEKLEKLRDDVRRMAAARQSDGAGPSRTRGVDDFPEPSSPGEINLANVEASPIPADWLTL